MPLSSPPRLLVIANPAAGQRQWRRLGACLGALAERGCPMRVAETEAPGDAERLARTADPGEIDAVIAAGGDGTVNEVANGLLGLPLPLGFVPLGTANVLAAELGQDAAPDRVAETIVRGRRRRVRLGRVNGRRFLLMAGAGFDAEVVEGVNLMLKRRTGKFAYVWRTVVGALTYRFPPLTVRLDGAARDAFGVVACRARHYAGPFVAAPRARMDVDTFQVCLLKSPGAVNVFRYGAALMLGRFPRLADVEIATAGRIVIEGPAGAPVQGDGDVLARLPAEIDLAPETIELIAPE